MRKASLILGMAAMMALTACAGGSKLNNFRKVQSGPDEFGILPTKPLSMPPDLAVLPQPTPGGANITDPTPKGDAVAVLGGNPARLADQGVAAADQALIAMRRARAPIPPSARIWPNATRAGANATAAA